MFNLIVSGRSDTWNGNTYRLELSRFGQYTDGEIAEQFRNWDDMTIAKLLSFPVLFAYEQGFNVDARIGLLTTIVCRSGQLRLEFDLCADLPTIPAAEISRLSWELEIEDWEMNRTHWAVKDVDLLPVLHNAGLLSLIVIQWLDFQLAGDSNLGHPNFTYRGVNMPFLSPVQDGIAYMRNITPREYAVDRNSVPWEETDAG